MGIDLIGLAKTGWSLYKTYDDVSGNAATKRINDILNGDSWSPRMDICSILVKESDNRSNYWSPNRLFSSSSADEKLMTRVAIRYPDLFRLIDKTLKESPSFIEHIVSENPEILEKAPRHHRSNPLIIKAALNLNRAHPRYKYLALANASLQKDRRFISSILPTDKDSDFWEYIADWPIWKNSKFCKTVYKRFGIPKKLSTNRDFIKIAVQVDGNALKDVDESIRDHDDEIIDLAIAQNPSSIQHTKFLKVYHELILSDLQKDPTKLQEYKEIIQDAVKENPLAWPLVGKSLRMDRAFTLDLINLIPAAFEQTEQIFRSDPDFVLDMLRRNGLALEFVPADLIPDRYGEFIQIAALQNPDSWQYVDERVINHQDLVLSLIERVPSILRHTKLRHDPVFMRKAMARNRWAFKYSGKEIKNSEEFFLPYVEEDGTWLEVAGKRHKKSEKIVSTAVRNNGLALKDADETLRNKPEIVRDAIQQTARAFAHAGQSLRENRLFTLDMVKLNPAVFEWIEKYLQNDIQIAAIAAKGDPSQLDHVGEFLQPLLQNLFDADRKRQGVKV